MSSLAASVAPTLRFSKKYLHWRGRARGRRAELETRTPRAAPTPASRRAGRRACTSRTTQTGRAMHRGQFRCAPLPLTPPKPLAPLRAHPRAHARGPCFSSSGCSSSTRCTSPRGTARIRSAAAAAAATAEGSRRRWRRRQCAARAACRARQSARPSAARRRGQTTRAREAGHALAHRVRRRHQRAARDDLRRLTQLEEDRARRHLHVHLAALARPHDQPAGGARGLRRLSRLPSPHPATWRAAAPSPPSCRCASRTSSRHHFPCPRSAL